MEKINYSPYDEESSDKISEDLIEIINKKYKFFMDDHEESDFKIYEVDSPFILADNFFDISDANNDLYEIGVKRTKEVSFTAGAMYIEFVKDGDGVIIQGNEIEGYNVFILK